MSTYFKHDHKPAEAAAASWNRFDSRWAIALFGTAVGAGILFLPINAGKGGFWPLLIGTLLIGPMTYFAHRGLSRVICASPHPEHDITHVVTDYFGNGAGRLVTLLYFLAIYPIVLIYGVGITNTVDSLLSHQWPGLAVPRWLLAAVLIFPLVTIMVAGKRIMLVITQWLVYPLILILAAMSLYLIPSWSFAGFFHAPSSAGDFVQMVWLMLPVLIFSFNHSPAVSQLSVSLKQTYGRQSPAKASQILLVTSVLLTVFTMGFVWSVVLAIGPEGLDAARQSNLPILSYLANERDEPFIAWLGPAVAIAAIVSSFFGHWLGAHESAVGIMRDFTSAPKASHERAFNVAAILFLAITTWLAGVANPGILSLIESLIGPIVAVVLYLMPMYAIHKVEALKPFRGRLSNVFVVIAGLVAFSGILFSLMR